MNFIYFFYKYRTDILLTVGNITTKFDDNCSNITNTVKNTCITLLNMQQAAGADAGGSDKDGGKMSDVIVKMEHICKSFPGVKALDDVNLELHSGEVLALLGENGAGKSTLMKILSGVYVKDSGTMEIFGKEYEALNPNTARDAGVAIIHQEMNMCNDLTVAENMFLGRELYKGAVLQNSKMNEIAKKYLDELNAGIEPTEIVRNLPVSKQQMVEIATALSTNAKIMVMDEPTSALTDREIDNLFRIIRKFREEGKGIIYISHRLEELPKIADCVTIMRDGKYITSGKFKDFTMDEIIRNMVGREIKDKFPRVECKRGKKVFEVKNLNAGRQVQDISFSLYEGEIVGFAGLMGAGRTETTRSIFGVDPRESGEFFLDGKEIKIRKPEDAIKAGIVLAPEDRRKDGLCVKMTIRDNIALPNLDIIGGRSGVLNSTREHELCQKAISELSIKTPSENADADTLSGGNQQKVVIGKWLVRNSRVVMFDEPTRGIDVGAKVEIYNLMNQLKKQGIAVMFASSEMPEVIGIADRILVMCDGRITGELTREEATQDLILKYATNFQPVK